MIYVNISATRFEHTHDSGCVTDLALIWERPAYYHALFTNRHYKTFAVPQKVLSCLKSVTGYGDFWCTHTWKCHFRGCGVASVRGE